MYPFTTQSPVQAPALILSSLDLSELPQDEATKVLHAVL